MKKIFIACDTTNLKKIERIVNFSKTKKFKIGYKFGLELFYSKGGRNFISKIKNEIVFLDLKINDIPNTCASAIKSLKDIKNIKYLTVHINGGFEMLKIIKHTVNKINPKIKVLGVTILTSFSNKTIKEIGHTKSISDLVVQQTRVAKKAGLDGIVCSGYEVKLIKNICKNMEIVIPGIRMAGDKMGDQKRVMTPKNAFENGATSIVIGRSITQGNIKKNIQKLINSLK
tara:strand:+ start:582 stop:1268 length:687 start_codon:yes stop_codon:yes gene_type:complete